MDELLATAPTSWPIYVGFAGVAPLAVRVLTSYDLSRREQGTWIEAFFESSWLAFVLGVLEMLAYPALIASSFPTAIGAWLLFKTVHRTQYAPKEDRGPYNRYLVANAVILFASYLSARWAFVA